MFMQKKQEEQSSKQHGKGSSKKSASALMNERLNMQQHMMDIATTFATGELPEKKIHKPRRLRKLSDLRNA